MDHSAACGTWASGPDGLLLVAKSPEDAVCPRAGMGRSRVSTPVAFTDASAGLPRRYGFRSLTHHPLPVEHDGSGHAIQSIVSRHSLSSGIVVEPPPSLRDHMPGGTDDHLIMDGAEYHSTLDRARWVMRTSISADGTFYGALTNGAGKYEIWDKACVS